MKKLILKKDNEVVKIMDLGSPVFHSIDIEAEYKKRMFAKEETIKAWDKNNKIEWDHKNETFKVKDDIPGGMYSFEIDCLEYEKQLQSEIKDV